MCATFRVSINGAYASRGTYTRCQPGTLTQLSASYADTRYLICDYINLHAQHGLHSCIDKWQRDKSVTKRPFVTFPACEGTWRAMHSTLTAVLTPSPPRGALSGKGTDVTLFCDMSALNPALRCSLETSPRRSRVWQKAPRSGKSLGVRCSHFVDILSKNHNFPDPTLRGKMPASCLFY